MHEGFRRGHTGFAPAPRRDPFMMLSPDAFSPDPSRFTGTPRSEDLLRRPSCALPPRNSATLIRILAKEFVHQPARIIRAAALRKQVRQPRRPFHIAWENLCGDAIG